MPSESSGDNSLPADEESVLAEAVVDREVAESVESETAAVVVVLSVAVLVWSLPAFY